MSVDLGETKLQMDDWYIIYLDKSNWQEHSLWHDCDTPWLVYFGIWADLDNPKLSKADLRWRCCHCGEEPPEGILGAFILLESDSCAQEVQAQVNLV